MLMPTTVPMPTTMVTTTVMVVVTTEVLPMGGLDCNKKLLHVQEFEKFVGSFVKYNKGIQHIVWQAWAIP